MILGTSSRKFEHEYNVSSFDPVCKMPIHCKNVFKHISELDIKHAIQDCGHAIYFTCQQVYHLIKTAALISALVITKLCISISLHPVMAKLPSANSVFPETLIRQTYIWLTVPTVRLTELITRILPRWDVTFSHGMKGVANLSKFMAVGISEEFVFRGILQQGILREVPKFALKKLAPDHVESVDHVLSRIARITITAFLFALAHAAAFGASNGLLLPQFVGGLIFSTLTESNFSIAKLMCVHAAYDIAIVCLIGGFVV